MTTPESEYGQREAEHADELARAALWAAEQQELAMQQHMDADGMVTMERSWHHS